MIRHDFLTGMHRLLEPRNYLEIGVNDGRSLTLSTVPTIAIDPAPKVSVNLKLDLQLVKDTSDAFFARKHPLRHLESGRNPLRNAQRGRSMLNAFRGGTTLDLAFIDGMHIFEYALRDFMNVEKYTTWSSVIVLDDMLPRSVDEAARDRHTNFWTGDVYKVASVLRKYRPDLTVVELDTKLTGVVVVLGADASSTVLKDSYNDIVMEWAVADPQEVPDEVLNRTRALDADAFLAAPFWADLVKARKARTSREKGYPAIRAAAESVAPARRSGGIPTV